MLLSVHMQDGDGDEGPGPVEPHDTLTDARQRREPFGNTAIAEEEDAGAIDVADAGPSNMTREVCLPNHAMPPTCAGCTSHMLPRFNARSCVGLHASVGMHACAMERTMRNVPV